MEYEERIVYKIRSRPSSSPCFNTDTRKSAQGSGSDLHGMSEHKERYLPFMEYLQNRGYAAVIHDHRGHGKSIEREDESLDIFTTTPDGPLWRMPIRLRSGSKWSSPACLSIYLGTVWGLWLCGAIWKSMTGSWVRWPYAEVPVKILWQNQPQGWQRLHAESAETGRKACFFTNWHSELQ